MRFHSLLDSKSCSCVTKHSHTIVDYYILKYSGIIIMKNTLTSSGSLSSPVLTYGVSWSSVMCDITLISIILEMRLIFFGGGSMISSYPQDACIQISASGFAHKPSDPLRSLPFGIAIWLTQEYLMTSALKFSLPLLIFHQNKEPMLISTISKACIKVTWVHQILLQLWQNDCALLLG